LHSDGRELRRSLFSLKQIFQVKIRRRRRKTTNVLFPFQGR